MRAVEHQHSPTPEDIMEYLDGEGAASARDVIATHLAVCPDCQAVAASQREISAHAQAWTVDRAPASLTAPQPRKTRWTLPARWWPRPRPAVLTLSALVVTAALILVVEMNVKPTVSLSRMRVPTGEAGGAGGRVVGSMPEARILEDRLEFTHQQRADPPGAPRKRTPAIIRAATLRLVARDFGGAREAVENLVAGVNGFVDRMTVSGDPSIRRQLTGRLRVPADRLTETLSRLRQLGAVVEDSQSLDDATDQIVDLDARISNARATEKRLTEILQNRTGKLSEVLEVERELARVRLDVERLDTEKTNLTRLVSYSAIDLTIAEERKTADSPLTLGTHIRLAALDGIENLQDTALALLLFALRAGPSLAFWGALLLFAWFAGRRIFRLKPKATR